MSEWKRHKHGGRRTWFSRGTQRIYKGNAGRWVITSDNKAQSEHDTLAAAMLAAERRQEADRDAR